MNLRIEIERVAFLGISIRDKRDPNQAYGNVDIRILVDLYLATDTLIDRRSSSKPLK